MTKVSREFHIVASLNGRGIAPMRRKLTGVIFAAIWLWGIGAITFVVMATARFVMDRLGLVFALGAKVGKDATES